MIIDRIENFGRYQSIFAGGDRLAAFLASCAPGQLQAGSHPVPGAQLTVNVSRYQPREPIAVPWEAHRFHADVHLMLKGGEGFGWTHVQSLTTQPAYDPAADTALYDDPAPGSILTVPEGFFVLVWPWDAHRPTMATGPDRTPRVKGVVKILC